MIRLHPVVCLIPASVVVGPALVAIAVNERELESRLAEPRNLLTGSRHGSPR